MKYPYFMPLLLLTTLLAQSIQAQEGASDTDNAGTGDVVEMSGISIIGNRELPKTLFIVPWKNSEVAVDTDLTNTLNEGMQPVDQDVFLRELQYYNATRDSK
ncbi:MAG TPA: hypothetical protein VF268_14315 [Gammaproteobacteria bacterium]